MTDQEPQVTKEAIVAVLRAIVLRDPHFNPDYPQHEPAIVWLLETGYVQMTAGGPTPTAAGSNLYRLMDLGKGLPDLP